MNIYLEEGAEGLAEYNAKVEVSYKEWLANQTAVVVVKDEIAIAEHDAWIKEFFESLLA